MGMHRHRQYLQVADPPLRGELENNCPASGPDVSVGLGVELQSHRFDCSLRLELLQVGAAEGLANLTVDGSPFRSTGEDRYIADQRRAMSGSGERQLNCCLILRNNL
jgi:hypothetical protein